MSSSTYDPADDVVPDALWETIWLSTRDLSGQIPINYVPRPAVSLSTACFANDVYDDKQAEICISTLLSSQFGRLIVDLYWDDGSRQFQFCPVSLSDIKSAASSGSTSGTLSSSASLSSATLDTDARLKTTSLDEAVHMRRQTSLQTVTSSQATSNGSATPTTSPAPVQSSTGSGNITLYDIGPYSCSRSVDLAWFVQLVQNFLQATSDTIKANILLLEFNLHATLSEEDVNSAASEPTTLPTTSELVGQQFSSVMESSIYTPHQLDQERSNLNKSWFGVAARLSPADHYLDLQTLGGGDLSTSNGWPNAAYLLLQKAQRVLMSWGTVDPQMHGYNFSGDSMLFSANTFTATTKIEAAPNGAITRGCFANQNDTNPMQTNSSWATSEPLEDGFSASSASSSIRSLAQLTNNLTSCGISTELNQTLLNATADVASLPYFNISSANIWSWALGEPTNQSSSSEGASSLYRCALSDIRTSYDGRWRVESCNQRYHAACRISDEPYSWTLTPNVVEYATAASSCPLNSTFAVPRTGLEAAYLRRHLSSYSTSIIDPTASRGDSRSGVWVDFNSLDVRGCWTTGGGNATCPYAFSKRSVHERTVLVPVMAALVVLAVTAVTLFVKCNANRRLSRRRRRGEGGWDYEGVPS